MEPKSFKRKLFGSEIEVIIFNPDKNTERIIDEMYSEALRLQKIFNFYDSKSELSELNLKRKLNVSLELLSILTKSVELSKITNGKFDISLGREILKRKQGKKTEEKVGLYKGIKINNNLVSLEDEEIMLDFGSIAKGYITDCLGNFLRSKGVEEFVINSRGDLLFSGKNEHVIGVQHPRKIDETICLIKVKNVGVATSGDYKQFSVDPRETHILNRNKDWISITVVSKTLEEADGLATALFVSEKEEVENIMQEDKNSRVMIIDKDLNPHFYNDFEELMA